LGTWRGRAALFAAAGLLLAVAACGDDDDAGGEATTASEPAGAGAATEPAATAGGDTTTGEPAATAGGDTTTGEPAATAGGDTTTGEAPATGEGITLAVNPWTGSAVNAHLAKLVLESELGTPTELVDIDENATWPGLDAGDLDAVLEVWPSGHAEDYATYVEDKGSVVDLGLLGPTAKIGWYVPSFVVEEQPELATWEGFKDPELAKLFATAETGDLGQFTMGDPSYVSYDEQIIANLELPLQFVVAGSEAALITAIQQAVADRQPLLLNFWQPHWLQSQVELTEVELPEVTDACLESAAADDGNYECDYPVDELYKAASAGLEEKNPAAFAFLQKFQVTTEQQNEIAAMVDAEGMEVAAAAQAWIDANPDVVAGWLG
jgi:glycine betaine/proline transport system substrate-binding protein